MRNLLLNILQRLKASHILLVDISILLLPRMAAAATQPRRHNDGACNWQRCRHLLWRRARRPDPEQFDLQNMHWIGGNQRNVIFAIGFQVKLLTYLQSAHRQFISLSQGKKITNEQMPRDDKYLQEAFNSHRVTVQGVLDNCRVIGERAQWQLNAVSSGLFTSSIWR